MSNNIIIWGASGHAKVVAAIACMNGYNVIGYIDDLCPERYGKSFNNSIILGSRGQLHDLCMKYKACIALGVGSCSARMNILNELIHETFATLVHATAYIDNSVTLLEGTVVCPHAVINCTTQVGRGVIVNSAALIEHDCIIGDAVHVGPKCALAGNVNIGSRTWIGIGATIKDGITLGKDVIIGAGAVVVNDLPDNVVAYGVPARIARKCNENYTII